MEATIAKIKKAGTAEVWIVLREFQDRQYIDVREHFLSSDDNNWHPTKKGIMLLPELTSNIIHALDEIGEESQIGTIATIPKSKREEIQVGIREFANRQYAELRVWYSEKQDLERKPSSRGVTFRIGLSAAIADALRQANGLLEKGGLT